MNATQKTYRARETLLGLHRTLIFLLRERTRSASIGSLLDRTLGDKWLMTAKLARKDKHLQTAYGATLQAMAHSASYLGHVERAKQLWMHQQFPVRSFFF